MSDRKPKNPVERPKALRSKRVRRGGTWGNAPIILESAYRGSNDPSDRYHNNGFRIARTIKK